MSLENQIEELRIKSAAQDKRIEACFTLVDATTSSMEVTIEGLKFLQEEIIRLRKEVEELNKTALRAN